MYLFSGMSILDTEQLIKMPPTERENSNRNTRVVAVHWYRHGLRLHDNPSLREALQDADEFYPIFIFDGNVAGT